jgi:hypothetical protein
MTKKLKQLTEVSIWFVMLTVTSFCHAEQLPSTSNDIEKNQFIELKTAYLLSRQELKNCDIIIIQDEHLSPQDEKADADDAHDRVFTRVVIDYEARRCFMLKRSEQIIGRRKPVVVETFAIYQDGKGIASPNAVHAEPVQADFYEFLHEEFVPRPEFVGFGSQDNIPAMSTVDFAEMLLDAIKRDPRAIGVQKLADGTHRTVQGSESEMQVITIFDSMLPLPKKETAIDAKVSKEPNYQKRVTWENYHGYARATSNDIISDHTVNTRNGLDQVPGTMAAIETYKWIQCNAEPIEWPTKESALITPKVRAEFLQLEKR